MCSSGPTLHGDRTLQVDINLTSIDRSADGLRQQAQLELSWRLHRSYSGFRRTSSREVLDLCLADLDLVQLHGLPVPILASLTGRECQERIGTRRFIQPSTSEDLPALVRSIVSSISSSSSGTYLVSKWIGIVGAGPSRDLDPRKIDVLYIVVQEKMQRGVYSHESMSLECHEPGRVCQSNYPL